MALEDYFPHDEATFVLDQRQQAEALFKSTVKWRGSDGDAVFADNQWHASSGRIQAFGVTHSWSGFQTLYAKTWVLMAIRSLFGATYGDVEDFARMPGFAEMIERIGIESACGGSSNAGTARRL